MQTELDVLYGSRLIGKLIKDERGRCAFSYAKSWLLDGFSISPISLPLSEKVFVADPIKFEGIFGVFHDSLPDGWGTLTAIKALRKQGVSYLDLPPLERLCYLGQDALGALCYRPSLGGTRANIDEDYDSIALSMMKLIEDESTDLDTLFALSGSTGGARPKGHMLVNDEEWIVKFRTKTDPLWIGRMEYDYALAAKEAGIDVPDVALFPSSLCEGYFAVKRFDRKGGKRIHVISLSGLLESPHDQPFLDYVAYLQATAFVCKSEEQVLKAFRLACFNVLAHNLDDHAKNFAFLFDEQRKAYVVSPAFDLTFTPNQKVHEMTCAGEELPTEENLRKLYRAVHLPSKKAEAIIREVRSVVYRRLGIYLDTLKA